MGRSLVVPIAVAVLTAGPIGYLMGQRLAESRDGWGTTTSRLSPDETILASLVEVAPGQAVGRRVRVQLRSLRDGGTATVFASPEQGAGGPPGTERLIWSKDGTKLLLVGRHFFVKEDLFLDNGDQLYYLHDLPTGRSWCNSDPATGLPPLTGGMIEGIEFTESVRRKLR